MEAILNAVLDIYRNEYQRCIDIITTKIADNSINVVEFNIGREQYFVDMENNIYTRSNNKDCLLGVKVGYLKDHTVFLGALKN